MSDTLRVRLITGVISTDDIIPARYKHMYTDPAQMAPHVFETAANPLFVRQGHRLFLIRRQFLLPRPTAVSTEPNQLRPALN